MIGAEGGVADTRERRARNAVVVYMVGGVGELCGAVVRELYVRRIVW